MKAQLLLLLLLLGIVTTVFGYKEKTQAQRIHKVLQARSSFTENLRGDCDGDNCDNDACDKADKCADSGDVSSGAGCCWNSDDNDCSGSGDDRCNSQACTGKGCKCSAGAAVTGSGANVACEECAAGKYEKTGGFTNFKTCVDCGNNWKSLAGATKCYRKNTYLKELKLWNKPDSIYATYSQKCMQVRGYQFTFVDDGVERVEQYGTTIITDYHSREGFETTTWTFESDNPPVKIIYSKTNGGSPSYCYALHTNGGYVELLDGTTVELRSSISPMSNCPNAGHRYVGSGFPITSVTMNKNTVNGYIACVVSHFASGDYTKGV